MANKIYDRQSGESVKAYEAFAIYRDLGVNRSIDAVVNKLNKSRQLLSRWSGDYNWVERAAAYDDFVDAQARKKLERDAINRRADMLRRHALSGKVLQQKGVEYLSRQGSPGIDRGADAIAAIKTGIAIERQAESLPEHLMAIVEATDDELARQYNELLAQIGSAGSGDEETGDGDSPAADPSTAAE